jgi:hypothetical protein
MVRRRSLRGHSDEVRSTVDGRRSDSEGENKTQRLERPPWTRKIGIVEMLRGIFVQHFSETLEEYEYGEHRKLRMER